MGEVYDEVRRTMACERLCALITRPIVICSDVSCLFGKWMVGRGEGYPDRDQVIQRVKDRFRSRFPANVCPGDLERCNDVILTFFVS